MLVTCSRMALAFSMVSGGRFIALRRSWSLEKPAGNFWTWNTCVPSTLISFSIADCMTEIAVITAIMDAMPATMPSSVRLERSLLPTMARVDMAKMSAGMWIPLLITQRLHRIESRPAQGRHEARDHAGARRDGQRQHRDTHRQTGRHHELVDHGGQPGRDHHTHQPTTHADGRRLEQKLRQNAVRLGTDGLADPDFPGTLGHRPEHDVHHTDSAHKART